MNMRKNQTPAGDEHEARKEQLKYSLAKMNFRDSLLRMIVNLTPELSNLVKSESTFLLPYFDPCIDCVHGQLNFLHVVKGRKGLLTNISKVQNKSHGGLVL
ncbi:hypothetical protein AVEN_53638-1 [Araneus ventricosus]|uniref:Uncharacterized protein n=1 Tax=Araneus ventricosus TaxID=182803 RepID=A0A4Y2T8F5_ARAVE|nr:hypothetical protein AVEN_53638-1 [Araneus ventricosus]